MNGYPLKGGKQFKVNFLTKKGGDFPLPTQIEDMAEERVKTVRRDLFHAWEFGMSTWEPVCAHFGCPKHLTLRESLFSPYCINHQKYNYKL